MGFRLFQEPCIEIRGPKMEGMEGPAPKVIKGKISHCALARGRAAAVGEDAAAAIITEPHTGLPTSRLPSGRPRLEVGEKGKKKWRRWLLLSRPLEDDTTMHAAR
jgi:hypothetical protein